MPGLSEWEEAFWRLSSERQIGAVIGIIPQSAIDDWIEDHDIDADEAPIFDAAIHAMDAVFLEHLRATAAGAASNVSTRPAREVFDAIWG